MKSISLARKLVGSNLNYPTAFLVNLDESHNTTENIEYRHVESNAERIYLTTQYNSFHKINKLRKSKTDEFAMLVDRLTEFSKKNSADQLASCLDGAFGFFNFDDIDSLIKSQVFSELFLLPAMSERMQVSRLLYKAILYLYLPKVVASSVDASVFDTKVTVGSETYNLAYIIKNTVYSGVYISRKHLFKYHQRLRKFVVFPGYANMLTSIPVSIEDLENLT